MMAMRAFGNVSRNAGACDGHTPNEAIEIYGQYLTEFEKIEMGMYDKIYTIGKVRRPN